MLAIGHVYITDDINDATVGLFGKALILAAVTSLHVEDGDMQTFCADNTQAAIRISKYQDSIGLDFHHQLIALGDDIAHGLPQVFPHGIHIHIGVGQLQILKENPVQVIIIILPSVCQQAVEIRTAFINHRCQPNNFRPSTYNDKKLQLPVILKSFHVSNFYISQKPLKSQKIFICNFREY